MGGIMQKDFYKKQNVKLLMRQRILLRAFFVNTVLVLLVWGLTFIPALMYFGVLITGLAAPMFYVYTIGTLALWGLGGVMFFLVPGIAVWWERVVLIRHHA